MNVEENLERVFHMPPGLEGAQYKFVEEEDTEDENVESGSSDSEEFSGTDDGGEYDSVEDDAPLPPDYVSVVSQVVRTLPGGGQVVDVTLELPDLENGIMYDMRVTKS